MLRALARGYAHTADKKNPLLNKIFHWNCTHLYLLSYILHTFSTHESTVDLKETVLVEIVNAMSCEWQLILKGLLLVKIPQRLFSIRFVLLISCYSRTDFPDFPCFKKHFFIELDMKSYLDQTIWCIYLNPMGEKMTLTSNCFVLF